jgi:iron(III) transport system ATP-binding protein
MASDLRLVRLRKEFGGHRDEPVVVAVDDVDLEVEKGQLVTLLGPSGCGKTTLLRMIAGFEEPTRGEVWFGERRVDKLAPNARDTAMVFQSYAIFPHLNVYENVAFGLRMQRMKAKALRERVGRVLELVGLTPMAERAPSALSGGQQQRVALARCIVMEPRLLLFDEPLSNLDAKLREQMRIEIRDLQQRLGITSVYVTHDQIEAMSMSDQVVVMNAGRVEQVGPPEEIYARPRSRFVADFIGKANFVEGRVVDEHTVQVAEARLPLSGVTSLPPGSAVTLVARPEATRLEPAAPDAHGATPDGGVHGTVTRAMFLGSHAEYMVDVDGAGPLQVDASNPAHGGMYAPGDRVLTVLGALHALPDERA